MHPSEIQPGPAHGTPADGDTLAIVAAIPARWDSTRLPGKPLRTIAGRPMIEHVYRRTAAARGLDRTVVLTDDARIADAVAAFGGEALMTPKTCASGTDRIAWAARQWPDVHAVVNVQGDEPLIDPAVIEAVAEPLRGIEGEAMVTVAAPASPEELDDPNAVKVVLDHRGHALYFSRARIPHHRDPDRTAVPEVWKHIGLYGYRREVLLRLAGLPQSPLERAEALEQLRALEHGIPIRVLTIAGAEPGVDTPADLARAEARLAGRSLEELR